MSPHHASPATTIRPDQPRTVDAPTPSRWLGLAQAGWVVAALLALGIFAASIPGEVLNFGKGPFPGRVIAAPAGLVHALYLVVGPISFAAAPVCLGLAWLLVWRKPGDRMALFVSFYLLLYGTVWAGPLDGLATLISGTSGTGAHILHDMVNALHPLAFWWATLALLALFPTGRFEPSWTRWLVLLAILTAPLLVYAAFSAFQGQPLLNLSLLPIVLYMSLTLAAAGYAQVSRYRHVSSPTERQQTKWAVSGLVVAVLLISVEGVLFTTLLGWPPRAALPWWAPGFGLLHALDVGVVPLTLTVAVLRYRVFDIDLLIRRTLVYGSLTAILGTVYVALVLGAQAVVQALTGRTGQQPVFLVISTLLVAALFNPLRRRLQAGIDQRFYRRKYRAAQTLAAFGATLRSETDLAQLSAQLVAVVEETMQPAHVSLWVQPTTRRVDPFDPASQWSEAVWTTRRASSDSAAQAPSAVVRAGARATPER